MGGKIKILSSIMYVLLLSSNIALTGVQCKSVQCKSINDTNINVKDEDEYNRYKYALNKLKSDKNLTKYQKNMIKELFYEKYNERTNKCLSCNQVESSKVWDPTTIGLPRLKATSHYICLRSSISEIEVEKKSNNKILLLAAVGSGIGGMLCNAAPIVGQVACGALAIVAGHQYYLEKLPNDVSEYKEQYFRWINTSSYKYEYRYISGFKDKNGNILNRETHCTTGDFDYLVD
ncbi:hypothetical protein [Clostridium lundense]|uniref:hypothetical protein n=1 Tax=Clostridium lundense TaxID=319475 RepID=UPI0004848985|nr:hypothetical protein [Clostridium lundense]